LFDSPPVSVYTADMVRAALFLFLSLLMLPSYAFAQGDAVSGAINIVENFQKEANILMRSSGLFEVPDFMRNMAVKDLEQIKLTNPPGARRSERVFGIVSSFTMDVVSAVESRGGMLAGPERERHADAIRRLRDLRSYELERLRDKLTSEIPPDREPEGIPSMDISPYDEERQLPDGPPGILFR